MSLFTDRQMYCQTYKCKYHIVQGNIPLEVNTLLECIFLYFSVLSIDFEFRTLCYCIAHGTNVVDIWESIYRDHLNVYVYGIKISGI